MEQGGSPRESRYAEHPDELLLVPFVTEGRWIQ
jgi:hypothetical protein